MRGSLGQVGGQGSLQDGASRGLRTPACPVLGERLPHPRPALRPAQPAIPPTRMLPSAFKAGRVVLAIDFMVFTLRLIHIFAIHKQLGPKIIAVERMVSPGWPPTALDAQRPRPALPRAAADAPPPPPPR